MALKLAVYASCLRHRRLRNTCFQLVATLSRVIRSDDMVHQSISLSFDTSLNYGLFTAR